jgi:hypothetical protein
LRRYLDFEGKRVVAWWRAEVYNVGYATVPQLFSCV